MILGKITDFDRKNIQPTIPIYEKCHIIQANLPKFFTAHKCLRQFKKIPKLRIKNLRMLRNNTLCIQKSAIVVCRIRKLRFNMQKFGRHREKRLFTKSSNCVNIENIFVTGSSAKYNSYRIISSKQQVSPTFFTDITFQIYNHAIKRQSQ